MDRRLIAAAVTAAAVVVPTTAAEARGDFPENVRATKAAACAVLADGAGKAFAVIPPQVIAALDAMYVDACLGGP